MHIQTFLHQPSFLRSAVVHLLQCLDLDTNHLAIRDNSNNLNALSGLRGPIQPKSQKISKYIFFFFLLKTFSQVYFSIWYIKKTLHANEKHVYQPPKRLPFPV